MVTLKSKKQKFHQNKRPILIKNKDINKIVLYTKISFDEKGFKYFIGYKDAKKVIPLCTYFPKMSAYRIDFDETKYMFLLIKDHELLETYNEIWVKAKNSVSSQ